MNLNAAVQRLTRAIEPSCTAWLATSTGWTLNADYSRSPTYVGAPVTVDVQALSSTQLEHMDALNISGILRSAYFNGTIEGLDRIAGKGGDLLTFTSGPLNGQTWLCVQVLENWDTGGWVKVVIQLQAGATPVTGNAAGVAAAAGVS